MPRFAANLSFQYNEYAFLDRFAAAASDGFQGVEFLFPYAFAPSVLAEQLQRHGLEQVLFNAPPAGKTLADMATAWERGERGTACLPGREAEFQAGIGQALAYAAALNCRRIHVMAGLAPDGVDRKILNATYVNNLRWAATLAASAGVRLMIEPINGRDMPGYFLQYQADAHAVVREVGSAHVQVQMDIYHCQTMEGDILHALHTYLPTGNVGHLQIAGVPTRNEPDQGELPCAAIFEAIDRLEYTGWIGCEYRPVRGTAPHATRDGLGWMPQ